jgi:hypothetical protein
VVGAMQVLQRVEHVSDAAAGQADGGRAGGREGGLQAASLAPTSWTYFQPASLTAILAARGKAPPLPLRRRLDKVAVQAEAPAAVSSGARGAAARFAAGSSSGAGGGVWMQPSNEGPPPLDVEPRSRGGWVNRSEGEGALRGGVGWDAG